MSDLLTEGPKAWLYKIPSSATKAVKWWELSNEAPFIKLQLSNEAPFIKL
jgi:hypothetical protein